MNECVNGCVSVCVVVVLLTGRRHLELRIRFVFEKNNILTISVLNLNVVSVTHSLSSLMVFFSICIQSPVKDAHTTEKNHPMCYYRYHHKDSVQATEIFFFFMRVNMTLLVHSQKGNA